MEYIQAFLFTSKYLLGRSGNTDMFYLFASFVLCFYLVKRREKASLVIKIASPIGLVCLMMGVFYPWALPVRCFVFFAKMLLNITLLVYVATNCKKWRIIRFAHLFVLIHAVETVFALVMKESALWVHDLDVNGEAVYRLRLFYMDAGSMAFSCGLVLVLLVYELLTNEVIWKQIAGIFVMVLDLYLSYGMGGIGCAFFAIVAMLLMAFLQKVKVGDQNTVRKYFIGAVISLVIAGVVFVSNDVFLSRLQGILNGTDVNMQFKLVRPLRNLRYVLSETHFLGVGFGNGNTQFATDMIGGQAAYPNSFLRIIAEGGFFGIALIGVCVIGIGFYCVKYGSVIDKAMFLYIVIYQMTGGYFTDSANFFVYGWVMGDCLNNKVEKTGKCSIRIFLPIHKDSLRIAMIGHKRIPSREGGVEIVVEELSKRMVGYGHSVDAYNRSGNHVSGSAYNLVDYDNLKEYRGIRIVKIPTIPRKGIAAFVYSFIASLYVVWKDYDVVHYHAEGPSLFLWIPSLFGIRTVCTIHGLDWNRSGKWGNFASQIIKMGEIVAVLFADEMIVLSRHCQQYFQDTYNRQTILIPNGVNRPERKEADHIREKWGLCRNSYFLALSRLTREKKTDLLIDAFKKVETDKKLVIAGGSSDTDEYVVLLKKAAEGDDRILFTDFVQGQDLEELYSNAYVYVLPSELEGMPLSLLEAMSYGNCCLTSDIPENTDVVRQKGVSFLTNDEADLVEKLQELADQPEMVQRYQCEATDYICGKYDWEEVVDRTLQVYYKTFR